MKLRRVKIALACCCVLPTTTAAFSSLLLVSPLFSSQAYAQEVSEAAPSIVPPSPLELPPAQLPDGVAVEDHDVQLVLVIDAEGKVSSAEVSVGVGEPWDSAAREAALRFRFTPALINGVPQAVQVPFTYAFRKPSKRANIIASRRERRELEQAPGLLYAGRLLERGTRTPQAGVLVTLRDEKGQAWEALSQDDGRFVVYGLPEGKLTLDIFTAGFDPLERSITVSTDDEAQARKNELDVYLAPDGQNAYRTVVRETRPPKAATEITLVEDELTKVAGTFGDPTRVVSSLPGVSRSSFGLGYYVVRGAQSDNTGFFIDGHPSVYLYHLLGGPGVIHPELVGALNFYPGGYPASMGRVASGAVAVETKDPPRDRWHLDLEVDIFKAGVLFSVPFDDKKGIASVSLRRSYYDLLLPAFTDDISLSYTDYQARVSYDFTPKLRARFIALGAIDTAGIGGLESSDGSGTQSTDLTMGFHRLNTAVEADLSSKLQLRSSLMYEYDFIGNKNDFSGTNISLDTDLHTVQLITTLRYSASEALKVDTGLDLTYTDTQAKLSVPSGAPIGDPRPPAFNPTIVDSVISAPYYSIAPFVSGELQLTDSIRLLPGIRLNLDRYGEEFVATLDPKLALRWQIHPQWTLKAMGAMAHQPPQVFQYAKPLGDGSLPPAEGIQGSLGFEWRPAPDWLVSVDGFYQHLDNLVQAGGGLANDEGEFGRVLWNSDLDGRAYGLELLVRKEFGGSMYGWLSYTLSRAERLRPPKEWTLFEQDQTHNLNLAWTVRLGNEWSLGARFQLSSGNPYYPIVGSRYNADSDIYTPIYASERSRLPVYHRLDLRLDKTWRFETWMMEVFLDIQNVYNAQNPESPRYSYDYRVRTEGISLPILPSIGFRMVF